MLSSHSFTNLSPTTFLERSARAFPEARAIVFNNRIITFSELLSRCRSASDLLRDLNIHYGDKIGLLCENSIQTIEVHFATPAVGGVIVSINPWLLSAEIINQLKYSHSKVLFVSEKLFNLHGDALMQESSLHKIIITDLSTKRKYNSKIIDYEGAIESRSSNVPLDQSVINELDPIAINFTSGTTGKPKGVVYTHRAAYLHAIGQVLMMNLNRFSAYFWSLPMFHVNGWGHIWSCVAIGAQQILVRDDSVISFDKDVLKFMSLHDVTHMAGAPRLIRTFVEACEQGGSLNPLTILTGGAAPTPELITRMDNLGHRLIHQYGLNETCGPFVVCEEQELWHDNEIEEEIKKRLRQGVPAIHAGTGLRVVDSMMNDVPMDGKTQGEVVMAGNTVALEYYDNQEATDEAFSNGWFHSGDIAVVHTDGFYIN